MNADLTVSQFNTQFYKEMCVALLFHDNSSLKCLTRFPFYCVYIYLLLLFPIFFYGLCC